MNIPNNEPDSDNPEFVKFVKKRHQEVKNVESKILSMIEQYVSMTTSRQSRYIGLNPNNLYEKMLSQYNESIDKHSDTEPDWM
jgi:flagellar biosynthesis chaperone FliJ